MGSGKIDYTQSSQVDFLNMNIKTLKMLSNKILLNIGLHEDYLNVKKYEHYKEDIRNINDLDDFIFCNIHACTWEVGDNLSPMTKLQLLPLIFCKKETGGYDPLARFLYNNRDLLDIKNVPYR